MSNSNDVFSPPDPTHRTKKPQPSEIKDKIWLDCIACDCTGYVGDEVCKNCDGKGYVLQGMGLIEDSGRKN